MTHDDDLWNFALACYDTPGVEQACLSLQAKGVDVCLLLACTWLESRGISYGAQRLEQLKQLSIGWQTGVVVPLRSLRQAWREQAGTDVALAALRKRIKTLELDAERIQLDRLQQVTQSWQRGSEANQWLDQLCTGLGDEARASLNLLRRAASAQLDAEGVD